MSDDTFDLNELFMPTSVFIGWDVRTGEPVYLPLGSYLGRNAELIAPSGRGKTDRFVEDLRILTLSPSGYVYYDFADTGFDQARLWDAYVAELLASSIEGPYADSVEEFRGLTRAFIGRHGYAVVGGPNTPIRINPLRRCVFPDGSRESVEDVVGRMDRVFAAQYADYDKRVLFARILRMVVALLAAAERELPDWHLLLGEDPLFRRFVISEAERLGTLGDSYVRRQVDNLTAHLALSARDRRDEVSSFVNSFEPFAAGSIAAFFSNENFRLEDVVYGGRRLFLSVSGLNGTEIKKFVMRVVWCACDTLISKRRFMDQEPVGVEFIDEIAWLPHDFFDVLTRRRNNRWSSVTARQDLLQFEQLGFRGAERLSEKSSATRMLWKLDSLAEAKELAIRMDPIEPDGWWIERIVETLSTAQTEGSSIARTQATTIVDTSTKSTGWGEATQYDATGALTGTTKSTHVTDGLTRGSNTTEGTNAGTNLSTTVGVTRTPHLSRLTFDEQQSLRGQALIRKPKHVSIVDCDGVVQPVLMRRARQLPFDEAGRMVLENYVALNAAIHEANTVRLPAFNGPVALLPDATETPPLEVARPRRQPRATVGSPTGPVPDRESGPTGSAKAEVEPEIDAEAGDSATGSTGARMPTPGTTDRADTILAAAAVLRFLTVTDVIALIGTTYDTANRELTRLSDGDTPLLDGFRPPIPRGQGSVPTIYVLNGTGARHLADLGLGDLDGLRRVVHAVGVRRRDIEQGNPTQIRHALAVSHFVALLWRAIWDRDPSAALGTIAYDRELACVLPAADVATRLPEAERPGLSKSADATTTTYIPDFFFSVDWAPDGGVRRHDAFAVEVETGAGDRNARSIGAQKAARIGVVLRDAARTRSIGPFAFPTLPDIRTVVWTPDPAFHAAFSAGVQAVQRADKNQIWTTNGDALPLVPARGTEKRDLPSAVRSLSRRILGDPIWSWVRHPGQTLALLGPSPNQPTAEPEA